MTKLFTFLSVLLFASCDFMVPKPATDEQKKQLMKNVKFDQSIIANLSHYDNLKDFLLFYGDTIIAYRDSKNYVIQVYGGGKMDTVLEKQDCYNFFQGDPSLITNVPNFLKHNLDSIYRAIGDGNIKSFAVCKDKKVTIEVRSEGGENGLYTSHNLMWNTKIERDYAYSDNKDTLLNENWIYRIGMTEHHGH